MTQVSNSIHKPPSLSTNTFHHYLSTSSALSCCWFTFNTSTHILTGLCKVTLHGSLGEHSASNYNYTLPCWSDWCSRWSTHKSDKSCGIGHCTLSHTATVYKGDLLHKLFYIVSPWYLFISDTGCIHFHLFCHSGIKTDHFINF